MRGGGLARERAVAIDAIDGAAIHRARAWERDAHAGPYCSEAVCLGHARMSDALVLLVAEDLTPITRREYLAAKAASEPSAVHCARPGSEGSMNTSPNIRATALRRSPALIVARSDE